MTLALPPANFDQIALKRVTLDPAKLYRVSRHGSGEPFFGRSGSNRFDDPRIPKQFGTCYLGTTLKVAIAESLLHDEIARNGGFTLGESAVSSRFVVRFQGDSLTLADCTGAALKRCGADGSFSTQVPYDVPQQWALAIHRHPDQVDGFTYVSRHMNTHLAVALFERAGAKLRSAQYTVFKDYSGALRALRAFNVRMI